MYQEKERRQETTNKTILRIISLSLLIYCLYNLGMSIYTLSRFEELRGLSIHEFGYPKKFQWVFFIAFFWFFFSVGFLLSFKLKKAGWVLFNAFILIGCITLLLKIIAYGISESYFGLCQMIVLLCFMALLSRKTFYSTFQFKSALFRFYIYAVLVFMLWGSLFLLVNEH